MDTKKTLYRTIKRMIETGRTDGLVEKVDIFYAADKLYHDDYIELIEMLATAE